jgi:hypothetical protein
MEHKEEKKKRKKKKAPCYTPPSSAKAIAAPTEDGPQLEERFVHNTYDLIATHFSSTRYKVFHDTRFLSP